MKKLVVFAVALATVGSVAAAEIMFTGGEEGTGTELTEPTNWDEGVCPGADDVAVVSDVAGTNLTLAADLTVAGLKVTADAALMTIEPADAAAETLPRLRLGASGVTLKTAQSKENGLVLRVPVDILAEQSWEIGKQVLKTYQPFYGTAKVTFNNAYVIDHYAAPRYDGELSYFLPNIEWNQRVNLREEAKWANKVTTPADGYFTLCPVVPSGEKWQWSNIFPSGTQYNPTTWMVTGRLLYGGSATSEMTVDAAAAETISCSSTTATSIGPGIFNLTGGNLSVGCVFGLIGGTTFRMTTEGTLTCSSDGHASIMGMDTVQDVPTQVFDQRAGTVNNFGLMIGGVYGDWEQSKNGFGQYLLGGGTLNVKASTGWNSFGGGLCLAAKAHTRGNTSCAPGVFTQTGGVANVDFVRFGVEKSGTSYANTQGFGLLDLAGGRFNLGSSGFALGSTWNYSTAASYASNACYRVRLTGGTFAPTATVLKAQMDLPPSETPVCFEPQRDLIVQAPVWGEGTLRKTGAKKLVLTDVSRFTGEIDVEEGALELAAAASDPDDASCIKWTGDSAAAAGYQDGDTVETWPEANNDGARKAVGYTAAAGRYQPPCPTLEANAFGAHAGVKFDASAMSIPTADNPVSGQTNWTVVVVFKTKQTGGCDNNASSYQWCYSYGLLGNTTTGWQDEGWGLSAGNQPVSESVVFGVGYAGNVYAPIESARGGRADGKVHVVVCTQSTWDQVTTVNLDGVMTSRGGNGSERKAHARYQVPCYLGFHTSDAAKKTDAAGFAGGAFKGTFAEIRFYQDRVLTVNEQNALIRALQAKYGDASAADVPTLPTPAVAFDADSVDGADGSAVETWTAEGGALAATQELGGGQAAPTLAKGTFAGHNALRFDAAAKSALGLAHDSIPWLGQKNLGAAIVFRTTTDGLDDQHDTYGNTIQGRGLLSTSGSQKKSVNGFSLTFRQKGTVAAFYKTTDLDATNFRTQLIHAKKPCLLNDGAVHVAVTTYDESAGKLRLMVDGYYIETSYAATKAQDSSQNLLIGSLCKSSDKYFTGEIAEVKLFSSALSRAEMQALTDDWAAKYKFQSLTGKLFTSLADVTGTGVAASRIRVAENATLAMPAATLGAGQELSVAGSLEGDLTLTAGATLKATVGAVGEIPSLTAAGAVTLDVTGLPQELPRWTPLLKVGSYDGDAATWTIVGDNVDKSLSVRVKNGFLGVYADKGLIILLQ